MTKNRGERRPAPYKKGKTKVTPLLLLDVTEARPLAWRSGQTDGAEGISKGWGEKLGASSSKTILVKIKSSLE